LRPLGRMTRMRISIAFRELRVLYAWVLLGNEAGIVE
jgi:hypothetical protein